MKKLKQVDVIENWYDVMDWFVETRTAEKRVHSEITEFEGMTELLDYRESGVYGVAGVPYTLSQISPNLYPDEEPYLAFAKAYSDQVWKSISQGNVHLATGSYCTHIPSILGGIRRGVGAGKRIGVVWLDAHADNLITEETDRENLTLLGVPMSTFLGETFENWRKKVGLVPPIEGPDVLASDIRYRKKDPEADRNLERSKVKVVNQADFNNPEKWEAAVKELASRVDVVFMHIDGDILHHDYVPAYEYDVEDGNSLEIVRENIKTVMETGKVIGVSVMCIGFPRKNDRLRDVNNMNGIRLVSSVLRNWKEQPEI